MAVVDDARVRDIALEGMAEARTGRSVGIVGAGPAGLTAAFDLAKLGHDVTVYEAKPEPGGMMRYGIPEYRLPYDRLDADIAVIRAAGADIRCDSPIGPDLPMAGLRETHDAVMLASGLGLGRSTRVPGTDHSEVRSAVDLLDSITRGESIRVPRAAVVIGGGNVAFDIARSLARLQKRTHGRVDMTLVALEERDHMLADEDEVVEAQEEGVVVINGRGPKEVVKGGTFGRGLRGLETVRCLSIFDGEGRFHPRYDEDDVILHEADMVIEAIGQASDTGYLGEELTEALEWQRGRIKIDPDGATSVSGLWAAGDMVEGPDVIHAVAAGHRVAASIHRFLGGGTTTAEAAE